MSLQLRSPAFKDGEMVPSRHMCDGENVSPPLAWTGIPEETESLALIMEDIDSVKGVWSHWVLYNVSPDVPALEAGVRPSMSLSWGGVQGRNDFDRIGYGGPCPSDGTSHRYVICLYAVDKSLELAPGATREEVLQGIAGRVIDEARLTCRYMRLADR